MSSALYARRTAEPLNDQNSSAAAKGGVFTSATFHYTEEQGLQSARKDSETLKNSTYNPSYDPYHHESQQQQQQRQQHQYQYQYQNRAASSAGLDQPQHADPAAMAAFAASPSPPGMYVTALYDYDADDRTSLSFRQGDVIQVITQLESGWWDGIINNVRGWFPSNYCAIIPDPENFGNGDDRNISISTDLSDASGPESELDNTDTEMYGSGHRRAGTSSFPEQFENGEEAAFWIPQATPDGRLYYYNTLTGIATTELPLEAPTSPDETGPRDRTHFNVPDTTPAPRNLPPYNEREEDDASASEIDESFSHRRQRRSHVSDGASPTASMDDLNGPSFLQRNQSADFQRPERSTSMANTLMANTLMATGYVAELPAPTNIVPRQAYPDNGTGQATTWNRLVENMERAVDSYRDAVNNAERSEYVRRAEDISDHLRMLLAAGSGTTDNHSGNPSIISTNRALYPHFRDMMSKFSKLVLSSHIAAADWPAPDSYSKCLQEANGVLHGVYGYVEVARQQSGDELPRLKPGFLLGANAGGAWRSLDDSRQAASSLSSSFIDQEDDMQDTVKLDDRALEQLDELRGSVALNLTRLNAHLIVREKIISNTLHEQVSSALCNAAAVVVESFKTYIGGVENLDIKGVIAQETQVATFMTQKQLLYDLIANLIISCQATAGPLGDEWADIRGDPFETRLDEVKSISKQLETALAQISSTLHGILELSASDSPNRLPRAAESMARLRSSSRTYPTSPYAPEDAVRQNRKLTRFFGEVPTPTQDTVRDVVDDTPPYLRLDFEGEIAYDYKVDPPQIRGGTFTALAEQLTRHDRWDPTFNQTFLLTYRSFTTAPELFEILVKRFSIQPPQGITVSEHQIWVDQKQTVVRLRTVGVLKAWIDTFWLEPNDEASNELLRRMLTFANDHVGSTNSSGANNLKIVIEKRLRGGEPSGQRKMVKASMQAPPPIVPKSLKKIKFLDIDPLEMARQLTLLESELYCRVKAYECLNKTWSKKSVPGQPEPAPNVKALIQQSNQLTNWVAEMILAQSDPRRRVTVIKHFVLVAEKCRQLNNFSGLTAIITALSTASIHRLNRTWGQVNQKTMNLLESHRSLMVTTRNSSKYRETLHSVLPPCIPFFGIYLTDLTFIEDGIPSVIKKTNLINFSKRAKTAEVIRDIQQYQTPYQLQPVPELQTYISDSMKAASNVHEMYDRSLQIEPREREDEKIARLLSESGFL